MTNETRFDYPHPPYGETCPEPADKFGKHRFETVAVKPIGNGCTIETSRCRGCGLMCSAEFSDIPGLSKYGL